MTVEDPYYGGLISEEGTDICLIFDVMMMKMTTIFFSKLKRIFSLFTYPTSGSVVTLKTGTREVPRSNPGCACRPSRSEFSVVLSETSVNAG